MKTKHCHYIDGKWLEGSGTSIQGSNPATDEIIWQGYAAGKDLVGKAVSAAKAAFNDWSDLDLNVRADYLKRFQETLLKNKSEIAEAISKSTGKPLWEALTEVTAMANKIPISIEAFQVRCPTTEKQQPNGLAITSHRAHGVMGVLGPYNFPAHLPNGHIIPALLAGNTVVFKPSEMAPLVAEITFKYWDSCGLPKGVINMVQGAKETGQALSGHEDLAGLLFTGSWQTGRHLSELMAKTPYKILALEMGGNNPLIIGKVENLQAAAYITVQSAFLTSGQRCTCARRLIVPKGDFGNKFISILIDMMKKIQIGPYTDKDEPFMGPLISKQAADQVLNAQKNLVKLGATPLVELTRLEMGNAFLSPGLIDVTEVSNPPDEEYFGPFLQVIRVNNFDEALQVANNTNYGLVASLISDSQEEFDSFFKKVRAGMINWNAPLTGASSSAPFGGIGQSGNNRPSAFYAADYCAYPIASVVSNKLQMPAVISPGIHFKPL